MCSDLIGLYSKCKHFLLLSCYFEMDRAAPLLTELIRNTVTPLQDFVLDNFLKTLLSEAEMKIQYIQLIFVCKMLSLCLSVTSMCMRL